MRCLLTTPILPRPTPLTTLPLLPQFHMGMCGEDTAEKYAITREQQDEYAVRSYTNAAAASQSGVLAKEIVTVSIPQKKGAADVVVKSDEEFTR